MYAHPYHLVLSSPWPILTSISTINLIITLAFSMHGYISNPGIVLVVIIVIVTSSIILWLRDVESEGSILGDHLLSVKRGLTIGFNLFVLSEVLIFASIFWAYLHSAINPLPSLGLLWAPIDIEVISATELPLLNTIVLLSSGATVTYAHHSWINNKLLPAVIGMLATLLLVVVFVIFQYLEYYFAAYTILDGVYGSVFYAGTGLHGFHIITLVIILSITTIRILTGRMESTSSINLDTTIVYSHVLDIIWLALFVIIYVWV